MRYNKYTMTSPFFLLRKKLSSAYTVRNIFLPDRAQSEFPSDDIVGLQDYIVL